MPTGTPRGFRGIFRQDDDARAVYSEAAGIHRIRPAAVAVPVDVDDLSALVEWARGEGAALIPRGSGSSMAGAAIGPGVIVDLSRWKDVDDSALDEKRIAVGPGVICAEVNRIAERARLRFPVSPSSAAFCTIGGMTATNAAGAQTLAFGAMHDWVAGIDCLFASGVRERIDRGVKLTPPGEVLGALRPSGAAVHEGVRKESSGYGIGELAKSGDVLDLLIGSEGTLALFTRIELALTELPTATVTVMGIFDSLAKATDGAIRASKAGAVSCELLDRTFLEFVAAASGHQFAAGTEAVLLAEAEGRTAPDAQGCADKIGKRFTASGATAIRVATAEQDQRALWTLRHAASPTLARLSDQLKSMQFIEDGCVPPDRLGDYVAGVREALVSQRISGVIFGHAGDGHVHVNPLIDPREPDWRARMDALLDEVTSLVARLGGTISGEHGDGRLRTPLLPRVWPEESLAAFREIKADFDPSGILNPGVKVGPAPDRWGIKYDPALPPHPPRAAAALARVEKDRAYSEFRLDLLDR